MRLGSSLRTGAAFGVLAAALAGCSSWPGQGQGQAQGQARDESAGTPMHRGPTIGAGASGTMGTGTASGGATGPGSAADIAPGQMGPGMGVEMTRDQQAMCDVTRNIARARTPEERQSLMDQYFAGMVPEMRERHLQMMQQQCSQ